MHVDGFRFDLAPVLARGGSEINLNGGLFETVRRDPELSGCKLIAEPWDLGENGYQLGRFAYGWSEWNDKYRDDVRDFWIGRGGAAGRLMTRFAGSPDVFAPSGRPPQASVNFITCHDGYTLNDLVSYQSKHNEANGEENRDGHDDNRSWNCGVEGPTDDPEINALRLRQKRNFIATLALSQGVPMLLGGDELGRTQRGNNNSYCQDSEISWFDWNDPDHGWLEFVAFLFNLRKQHVSFRRGEWLYPDNDGSPTAYAMAWYHADAREIHEHDVADTPPGPLQVVLPRTVVAESVGGVEADDDREFIVAFNPTDIDATFTIPHPYVNDPWFKIVDTVLDPPMGTEDLPQSRESFSLAPHALAVLTRP
jgi:glycogen operon protein